MVKADKGSTMVILNKDTCARKIDDFLQENQFMHLQKDPTEKFQKQLQQIIPKCKDIIDKQQKKYLLQIKPRPPTLKAQIKTHKENEPIRPVVNNIQAPTYKLAKFLNKWLQDRLSLPNTYVTYNSTILAHDLTKIKITESSRLATFDIKDLYVNIPIEETVRITKTLLTNTKINDNILNQACLLLETIMKQNYLQFDQKIYQPKERYRYGLPHLRTDSRDFFAILLTTYY